jgi:hypothetical protein
MIKQEIRSLIKNLLPKLDETNKYHDNVVDAACETILNSMIADYFNKESRDLGAFTKRYGDATALTVTTDAVTGVDYTTLPVGYVPVSDKASGVRNVFTVQAGGIMFYPMDAREFDLATRSSYFYLIGNRIGYVVYPTKVEYFGMTSAIRVAGVRMNILTRFRDLLDTDVVAIPGDRTGEFTSGVLQILGVIQPVSLTDDNKDNVEPKSQQQQ